MRVKHHEIAGLASAAAMLCASGCDDMFVTRLYASPDASQWPALGRPDAAQTASSPLDGGVLELEAAAPELPQSDGDASVIIVWGDGELKPLPRDDDAGLPGAEAPSDAGLYGSDAASSGPAPVCLLADDRDQSDRPGGQCPRSLCMVPYGTLTLRSEAAGFVCRDEPSTSYCSAALVSSATEHEQSAFGTALEHRSLYVLRGGDVELVLELDAGILSEPGLDGLARNLRGLHGRVGNLETGLRELRCVPDVTGFSELVDGVLHFATLCRLVAFSERIDVPLYLDTSGPLPVPATQLACAYHELESPDSHAPLVALDVQAPIVFAR